MMHSQGSSKRYKIIPERILRYLDSYSVRGKWRLVSAGTGGIDTIVIIPSLAEKGHLFTTLAGLSANDQSELERTLVVSVVNNVSPESADLEDIENNRTTLETLKGLVSGAMPAGFSHDDSHGYLLKMIIDNNLRCAYVDASSSGLEMPDGIGGVGLARKIGLDLALREFDYESKRRKLLVSLDADTMVETNYLTAVRTFFEERDIPAAVVGYVHQNGESPDQQAAIYCYENFLRYYVLGLLFAGSPYAFHSVGSTMVCTAEGYAAVRGMNRRKAGEDFYFLNKLAKLKGIGRIDGTRVYPSSRMSGRVPFGTGKRIIRFLGHTKDEYVLYDPRVFVILKKFLQYVAGCLDRDDKALTRGVGKIHPSLGRFLEEQHFGDIWARLKANSRTGRAALRHFHGWFDGFKTLKLIHYLTDNGMPPIDMFSALRKLLELTGYPYPPNINPEGMPSLDDQGKILNHLRNTEHRLASGKSPCRSCGVPFTGIIE